MSKSLELIKLQESLRLQEMATQVIKAPGVIQASDGETHKFDAFAITNLDNNRAIVAVPRDISDATFRLGSTIILGRDKFKVASVPKTFPEYSGYTRILAAYKADKNKDDRYYKFIVDSNTYDYFEVIKDGSKVDSYKPKYKKVNGINVSEPIAFDDGEGGIVKFSDSLYYYTFDAAQRIARKFGARLLTLAELAKALKAKDFKGVPYSNHEGESYDDLGRLKIPFSVGSKNYDLSAARDLLSGLTNNPMIYGNYFKKENYSSIFLRNIDWTENYLTQALIHSDNVKSGMFDGLVIGSTSNSSVTKCILILTK